MPSQTVESVVTVGGGASGETRDVLIAGARAGGWDVTGYRWLRMTRGAVTIEVWFADVTSRVVRARRSHAGGQVQELDIVHNREHRTLLDAVVTDWLDAPEPDAVRAHRARRNPSAAHSTEFEAIGIPLATRTSRAVADPGRTDDRPRTPAWVRTGISPV